MIPEKMSEPFHEIRICTNPGCGFRFPVSPTERRIDACPKCGSPTISAEAPYHSFRIREKNHPRQDRNFCAVLDNIRSAFNVGAMFRTADGCGIDQLYLCGITPTPEHPKVAKTALGAESAVAWEHSWDVLETVRQLKASGWQIWCLEGGNSAREIFSAIKLERCDVPLALVVGNEVSGVDPEVVKISNQCVYIPMEGVKESLNAAIAFGIAAYLLRYSEQIHE